MGKQMITKSWLLPPPVFLRTIEHNGTWVLRAGDCSGRWAALLVLLSPITLLIITLSVPEYWRFCWEISGFQMNHSPLSPLAYRTAASRSSGRSLPLLLEKELRTLSVSLPRLKFVTFITHVGQNRDVFSLLIHAFDTNDSQAHIAKQAVCNRMLLIGCY